MNIFLIGFMGAGKTYLGKKLAEELLMPFVDMDVVFENEYGNIPTFFIEKGETAFRMLESEILRKLNSSHSVVACGGGTPCYSNNLEFMKENGVVVFVNTPLTTILNRLAGVKVAVNRPLVKGMNQSDISELYHKRLPFYNESHLIWNPEEDWDNFIIRLRKQL